MAVSTPQLVRSQSVIDGRFEPLFNLPSLPYSPDALEPYIDQRTMQFHHDKQHAAYVAGLNSAAAEIPEFYFGLKAKGATEDSLADVLRQLETVPSKIRTAVRNNGGGHYNHSLFWQMMKKDGGGEPTGDLTAALNRAFGSFQGFKDQLTRAALGQFGSGWAWLTLGPKGLQVEATANEDTPLSHACEVLLGIDVWEHAYYLKYQNRRSDYVAAWFRVINWTFVSQRYAKLKT